MGFWMSRTDAAKARVPRATAIEPPWVGRFVTCNIERQMSKRTKHTRSFTEHSFTTV